MKSSSDSDAAPYPSDGAALDWSPGSVWNPNYGWCALFWENCLNARDNEQEFLQSAISQTAISQIDIISTDVMV